MQPIMAMLQQAIQQQQSGAISQQQFAEQFATILGQTRYGQNIQVSGSYDSPTGTININLSDSSGASVLSLNPTTGVVGYQSGGQTEIYTNIGQSNAVGYIFNDGGALANLEINANKTPFLATLMSGQGINAADLLDGKTVITPSYNEMTDATSLQINNSQDPTKNTTYNLYISNGVITATYNNGSMDMYTDVNGADQMGIAKYQFSPDPQNAGAMLLTSVSWPGSSGQSFNYTNSAGFILTANIPGGGNVTLNPGDPNFLPAMLSIAKGGGELSLQNGEGGNIVTLNVATGNAQWSTADGDSLTTIVFDGSSALFTKTVDAEDATTYQQVDGQGQATGYTFKQSSKGTLTVQDSLGDVLAVNPDGSAIGTFVSTANSSTVITVNFSNSGAVTGWSDNAGHSGDGTSFWDLASINIPTQDILTLLSPDNMRTTYNQINTANMDSENSTTGTETGVTIDSTPITAWVTTQDNLQVTVYKGSDGYYYTGTNPDSTFYTSSQLVFTDPNGPGDGGN